MPARRANRVRRQLLLADRSQNQHSDAELRPQRGQAAADPQDTLHTQLRTGRSRQCRNQRRGRTRRSGRQWRKGRPHAAEQGQCRGSNGCADAWHAGSRRPLPSAAKDVCLSTAGSVGRLNKRQPSSGGGWMRSRPTELSAVAGAQLGRLFSFGEKIVQTAIATLSKPLQLAKYRMNLWRKRRLSGAMALEWCE
jgi:hypothetical protein